jgi:enamine deaminase RidA (YjgF/YER057c/UK114 family)
MQTITNPTTEFYSLDCGSLAVSGYASRFQGADGTEEIHLVVRPEEYASFGEQLDWIEAAYGVAVEALGVAPESNVVRRFSCSDLCNQAPVLDGRRFASPESADCAVSWVGHAPAPPAKVALWAYFVVDPAGIVEKEKDGPSLVLQRGEVSHVWTTGMTCVNTESPFDQTRILLGKYDALLHSRGMTLSENVLRTWFFVQNIDANYKGFVQARRGFFAERGLTPETHFIASTGIEGSHSDLSARVTMDAYAVAGVRHEQVQYLSALDHLSPTHLYGVTFERGTAIAWRDRKHVLISGTASIDHQGRIVHPGDVSRQLERTIENIEALLKHAGASLQDMAVFLVYVRDPSDHAVVTQQMRERFGNVPIQVVIAHVCRPGWLVEVEGKAVIPAANPNLPAF